MGSWIGTESQGSPLNKEPRQFLLPTTAFSGRGTTKHDIGNDLDKRVPKHSWDTAVGHDQLSFPFREGAEDQASLCARSLQRVPGKRGESSSDLALEVERPPGLSVVVPSFSGLLGFW